MFVLLRAATPHPQVADDKLYRSTDASDPIAKRMRSIVSWSSQRVRDRMFRSVREDEMSAAQTAAKSVIDAFIDDVCSLRVDTSVPYQVGLTFPRDSDGTAQADSLRTAGTESVTGSEPATAASAQREQRNQDAGARR